MISKADVIERLRTLAGKEISSDVLHETIFCEAKHAKILRRYRVGTHTYVNYRMDESDPSQIYLDIVIPGNPNTFRIGVEEQDGKMVFQSEPRIKFSYL